MKASIKAGPGMGMGMVLFLIFLVLKLCGIITWSWWWVTAPLWIPIVVGFILIGIVCVIVAIFGERK